MAQPAANFPSGMPGEPASSVPYAKSGKVQPRSPHGPKLKKTVRKVKAPKATKTPPIPKAPAGPTEDALLKAAVNLRYAPQEQALNQQLGQNARFSSGTNDWYKNAQAEIAGLKAQGQAQSQQALQGIQSYTSQPTLPNATDQQAATARNNLNSEYGASFGQQSNANAAAMDRLAVAFLANQGNTLNQTNAQRQQLLGQQGQLGREKADFGITYGAQRQAAQQKADADKAKLDLATQIYTGVTKPLANSLMGDRKSGQKVARSGVRLKGQSQAETKHQNAVSNALKVNDLALKAYKLAHPNAGKGGGSNSTYSKSKVQGFRANWDYAKATAKQVKDKKTYTDKSGKVKPVTRDVTYSALLSATKDPDIAKAAALAAFNEPIPADLRHRLAIKGVHPPKVKPQKSLGQIVLGGAQKLLNP